MTFPGIFTCLQLGKMTRRKHLTDQYKGQILAFRKECFSLRETAIDIGRSNDSIWRFSKSNDVYKREKSSENTRKLSKTTIRAVFRLASGGQNSARDIENHLKLPAGHRRVQRLRENPNFQFRKRSFEARI